MSRPKLLIIGRPQFGYHTGCYYYCKYLQSDYEISYLGWDFGFPKVDMEGVRVIEVPRQGPRWMRFFRFIAWVVREARKNYSLRFMMYFPGCSAALALTGRRPSWILDIRTASVEVSVIRRRFEDAVLKLEARCFKHVTVISPGIAEHLGLRSSHILPPGAQIMSSSQKDFGSSIHLLYVGTVFNRALEETLYGFRAWLNSDGQHTDARYTIVGGGFRDEESSLRALIGELGLDKQVQCVGRVPHTELTPYFDSHNVGVSFIPTTSYYEHQPAFKTMEYLLAGMAVLATGTAENRRLVTARFGEIITADRDDFRAGLSRLAARSEILNSDTIRDANRHLEWTAIIASNLRPYLASIA